MEAIKSVWFKDDKIFVELANLIVLGTPVEWYPNLSKGNPEQRENYIIKGNGRWIYWEELDEDLSLDGFLSDINHSIAHFSDYLEDGVS
jgi:hypothetical protein